jgi:nucleoside-diphosphate-sugar epimerase
VDQIAAQGGRAYVLDALDREAVRAALQQERPDLVIYQLTDLAGRDFAANSRLRIDGSRYLVDAALQVGVSRMIAQSIAWVCAGGEGPSLERDPLDLDAPPPRGETVAAVQALEQAVAEMPIGVVLRYGMLYGPGTWFAPNGLTTAQLARGELTLSSGLSSFLHVADAALAAVEALAWPAGIYNIVDDRPAAGTDWLAHYAALVGQPVPQNTEHGTSWERGSSNRKARSQGWRPQYPDWRRGFEAVLTA